MESVKIRHYRRLGFILLPLILGLACAGNVPLLSRLAARPAEGAVGVTLVYRTTLTPTAILTATIAPLLSASGPLTPAATLPLIRPTDTPQPRSSPTVAPTNTPLLPPLPPTPLPTPTDPAAAAPTPAESGGKPVGVINLVAPDSDTSYPANVGGVEFKWHWSGGCQAPKDHGFQIRIRPAMTGTVPMGVMDVAKGQADIGCNVDTGFRSYFLNNLKGAPGVMQGQTHIGKFLWDVAYVKVDPYIELTISPPRIFEISLAYSGPIDPFGADLSCKDFPSWTEAQAIFIQAGGNDRHGLDPDGNGYACDELR